MLYHPLPGNPLITVGPNYRDPGDPRNYNGQYDLLLWALAGDWSVSATKITQWNDRSGKSSHLTQGTDADRFVVDATGFGGFAAASSTGGTIGMATPSLVLGVHTILLAMAGTDGAGAGFILDTARQENYMQNTTIPSSKVDRAGTNTRREVSSTWLKDGARKTAGRTFGGTHATHLIYVNGVDIGATDGTVTSDPGTGTEASALTFGNRQGSGGAAGLYREIIVYATVVPPQLMAILDRGIKSRCPGAIT